jgi:hypothetical protein
MTAGFGMGTGIGDINAPAVATIGAGCGAAGKRIGCATEPFIAVSATTTPATTAWPIVYKKSLMT